VHTQLPNPPPEEAPPSPPPEALRAAFLEASPDAIVSIDEGGTITGWNPAAETIFGYTRELAIGRKAADLLAPFAAPDPGHAEFALLLRGRRARLLGTRSLTTGFRSNGGSFPMELTLIQSVDRGEPSVLACIRDLTEHDRKQDLLRKSEERFRRLVEGVQDYAIHLLDPRGRVMTWNAGVERIEGYRARDIIGRRFNRFYTPEDIARGVPEHALATAGSMGRYRHEGWGVRNDGSHYWASVVLTALYHGNGSIFGYSRVGRDCTGERNPETPPPP
jgi:PAS domain S-box-containing protein